MRLGYVGEMFGRPGELLPSLTVGAYPNVPARSVAEWAEFRAQIERAAVAAGQP